MDAVDLAFTPALEQARLIRDKVVSPLELTELYLRRIEALNPQLASYVHVAFDQAIADAQAKTEQLSQTTEAELPPFFGVPLPVKDLVPVADMPCSYGLAIIKNRIAPKDDGVVTKLRQAGFVLLGKTITSEIGTLPYTEQRGFPPARNPWDLDYTAGGSSGGAAAAVAAGLCPLAHGSDGGGSVRGPAFCCGIVGIKPSRGRISFAPLGDRLSGIAANGPLARTVTDAAALLDVMSGYVPGDPYWLPPPEPSFLQAAQTPPPPLKIAMVTQISPVGQADPHCVAAVDDMAKLLTDLGHHIEPIEFPDLQDLIDPFVTVFQAVLAEAGIPVIFLSKMNRWWWLQAQFCGCGKYLRAVAQMQRIARELVQYLTPWDAVLMPTYMHPTIPVGAWQSLSPGKTLEKIIQWIAPCPPFNASGQPAIAIPTGLTPAGLPMGVQLVGRPADEATLFALAAQVENARPWTQRPPLAIDTSN